MAPAYDARTSRIQYFHKERYFTGPEDSLEFPILTINRPSFGGPQLDPHILEFSNLKQRKIFHQDNAIEWVLIS